MNQHRSIMNKKNLFDHLNYQFTHSKKLKLGNLHGKDKENTEQGILEQGFGTVRKSVQDVLKQFTGYTDVVTNTIDTGVAHSQVTLDYLREETNVLPRIGAVGVGGLSGLILGLRGGKLKKLVYSSTGALVVASICYPKQAQEGMTLAKHYINIGYNFVYGVKPGDANQLEISWPELPKVPSTLSEVADLAGSAAGSAFSAVGTLVGKASEAFHEFSEPKSPFQNDKPKKS
ncbi:apolipoprotein O-like isoform X7 [Nasonia vitripennis]|uniref:MICOS complex subunit n=1 Tax=Nasonia vitripennis TaxID=7425 RepID=A0A7M7QNN1_NASVI|nr:apolipoprotein O-like isoform X7 [Nasonia vitripennis]XP_032452214.1 apolipoprotein O-like isoform X7 [Nasonia vitripennis]